MAPNPRPKLTTDDIDDLIYACRTGDIDWLQELLKSHSQTLAVPESQIISIAIDTDEDGLGSRACLLHYPSANGNLDIVTFLLDRLSSSSSFTSTPSEPSSDSTSANTSSSNTPQANTSSTSSKNVSESINHKNINGNTPLHWAALNGHLEIVKALVKAGADPTIVNEAGRDAVVEAEYSSKEEAAECAHWLLKECDVLEQGAGSTSTDLEGQISAEEQEDTTHNGTEESHSDERAVNGVNGEKHAENET